MSDINKCLQRKKYQKRQRISRDLKTGIFNTAISIQEATTKS